jgi:putative hydrolase of the HAD superfamily
MDILGINDIAVIKKSACLFELIVNPVYPMPNLEKMLSACHESNVTMGIISNAQFYTKCLFEWFLDLRPEQIGFHPALTIYSYICVHAKPLMCMFDRANEKLKDMGICENDVLYLGNDMLNDISPAKKAGFTTALFAGDKRSLRLRKDHSECMHMKADMVITDLI